MTTAELNEIIESTFEEIRRLRETKGADYAHSDDAFDNFKRHAATLGLTPEQIWAVYAAKHWDAVMSYCKRGQVESEPIEGRIDDLLVYLLLLKGRVTETQREAQAHDAASYVPRTHMLAGAASGRIIPIRRVDMGADESWQGNESIRDEFPTEGPGDAA